MCLGGRDKRYFPLDGELELSAREAVQDLSGAGHEFAGRRGVVAERRAGHGSGRAVRGGLATSRMDMERGQGDGRFALVGASPRRPCRRQG